jgi:predicted NAD-dependent protein-ADP-ribosyltransferase YbiA (DUF1768 family)
MNEFIIIPKNPNNPKYGCLSNESRHGFVINDLYYQTVCHFIESKKFETTVYEEQIRNSKTANQAKHKTRGREALMIKDDVENMEMFIQRETIYGRKNLGYRMKPHWNEYCKRLLQTAIHAKFNQHPKLMQALLSTYPKKIIYNINDNLSFSDKYSVIILTKLRDQLIHSKLVREHEIEKQRRTIEQSVVLSFANPRCADIAITVMYICKYISRMEGWDTVLPEMVDDAIVNIYSKFDLSILKKSSKSMDEKYLMETRKKFIKIDKTQEDIDGPSKKVVNFMSWCILKEKYLNYIYRKIRRFKFCVDKKLSSGEIFVKFDKLEQPITIPPSLRWYRAGAPPRIKNS